MDLLVFIVRVSKDGRPVYLCDFSESSPLLSEVDDDSTPAVLRFLDGLFNPEDEVRSASAYIGAEHITAVALYRDVG